MSAYEIAVARLARHYAVVDDAIYAAIFATVLEILDCHPVTLARDVMVKRREMSPHVLVPRIAPMIRPADASIGRSVARRSR
jgi:hypothetical protein